jgi:hypothetical protein
MFMGAIGVRFAAELLRPFAPEVLNVTKTIRKHPQTNDVHINSSSSPWIEWCVDFAYPQLVFNVPSLYTI